MELRLVGEGDFHPIQDVWDEPEFLEESIDRRGLMCMRYNDEDVLGYVGRGMLLGTSAGKSIYFSHPSRRSGGLELARVNPQNIVSFYTERAA